MKKIKITHRSNGVNLTDLAVRIDGSFFEIISGKRKGNLVHVWDIWRYENPKRNKRLTEEA